MAAAVMIVVKVVVFVGALIPSAVQIFASHRIIIRRH